MKAKKALTPADVWRAPADYNRATRRLAKLFGGIWKWDHEALGLPTNQPARFIRRHFDSEKFLHPKTRRQRRVRTKIMRIMRLNSGKLGKLPTNEGPR